VPWHVKGVHPDAREVARDAARRSGLSVGEWLNSLIIDATANADLPPGGRPDPSPVQPRHHLHAPGDADLRFPSVGKQIDELKSQLDRLSQSQTDRLAAPVPRDGGPHGGQFAQTMARFERQSDQRGPNVRGETNQRKSQASPAAQKDPYGVDRALAEITARQHALDGEGGAPQAYGQPYVQPHGDASSGRGAPQDDAAMVEQQMRDIRARIQALQSAHRFDGMAAELTRTIESANPKRAIEGIEEQLRRLTSQLEAGRGSAPVDKVVDSLRRDLADIQVALKNTIPHGTLASLEEQIRALNARIADLGSPRHTGEIAAALRRELGDIELALQHAVPQPTMGAIEEHIGALNHQLSTHLAGLGAPPRIEDIAHALRLELADIEQALHNAVPNQAVAALEEQIRALNDQFSTHLAGLGAPPQVEDITNALRQDLVEIGAVLHDALPTNAIASLEQEVRALGERIGAGRGDHSEYPAAADFGLDLTEVRDRLPAMTPPEDVAQLSDAVRALSHKADAMASESAAPELLEQLEHAIAALHGLATQVASRDAVDVLSRDIHALADKVDRGARPTPDSDMMMTLDRRLAEMADALGRSRPAETQAIPADFDSIIQKLADRLESTQLPAADRGALKSLEARIVNLVDKLDASEARIGRIDGVERGMDDLLGQLKELRTQNEKKLHTIQQQLVTSATDAISVPAEAIRRDVATLKEIQTSADRRTHDTFEAVYGTIEQVVDRLATIEENLRARNAAAAEAPVEPSVALKVAAAPPIAPVEANLPVLDLPMPPAPIEPSIPPVRPDPSSRSAAGPAPAKATAAPAQSRQPIVSNLPPDSPLEPGLGSRRVRVVANAIDRIAASEAANSVAAVVASGASSAPSSGTGGTSSTAVPGTASGAAKAADAVQPARANFVAAARRAAQAVANEQAADGRPDKAATDPKQPERSGKLMKKFGPRIKSVVLGISVVMLVLGALRLAFDFFYNSNSPVPDPSATRMEGPAPPAAPAPSPAAPGDAQPTRKGASLGSPTPSGSRNATAFPAASTLGLPSTSGTLPAFVFPTAPQVASVAAPIPAATAIETTGSVPPHTIAAPTAPDPAPQPAAAPTAHDFVRNPLPATIGSKALITAATAGEPGASYEIAIRYSEGRGVPQDFAMAAAWFERAAQSGMAPAQFRLGSMYEKGLGIKKDLQEARRLYIAAADQGNPKAMHNLAVLYAEGLDGKPDYAIASQWFRKAAGFGVADSQYNLAILYARGVGVERDMAESYKWFALAAKGGDKDAAKKRDEVAARLDPPQLESAKQAAESFVAEHEPESATATRAPPGGWDQVASAAPTKPKAVH
jgi:localization factor PodJL